MITCPECGQQASDDARFCDRCGQGLANTGTRAVAASVAPLATGTQLAHGFRVIELLGQTSIENRYRVERASGSKLERYQLRERLGPVEAMPVLMEGAEASEPKPPTAENPNGPTAKTAELKLSPQHAPQAEGASTTTANKADSQNIAADETGPAGDPAARSTESEDRGNEEESAGLSDSASGPDSDDSTHASAATGESAIEAVGGSSDESISAAVTLTDVVLNGAESGTVPEAEAQGVPAQDDLGEVFGRVLALSLTFNHPAFQRALEGFAEGGRVYLVYPDETTQPLSRRSGGVRMTESEAINLGIQVCQAVGFVHRRGLRVNDLCPESVAVAPDGRVKLSGLDYVSNDNELQADPIFNDGYTAPEIYRGRKADKRADVFSVGALLYSCLTGERLDAETWREEAGPIRFYPPHVVTPALEQVVRRALMFDPAGRWPTIDAFKAELLKLSGNISVRAAVMTDVGMVRELNEDAVMAVEYRRDSLVEPAQNFLYVVADGMGGAEAGEVASAIAVGAIRNYVDDRVGRTAGAQDVRGLLQNALEDANARIIEYQANHAEARGMGSTAVSILIAPPEAAVAWVGDSRGYLWEETGLKQITKDHSLVQRLIEIGQITPDEARHHEHKNVITRSLGARQSGPAGAESLALRLKRGNRMLLCSDGLTAHVEDLRIGEILRRHSDPCEAARELVVAANAGGGTDNVSVVVIFTD